MNKPDGIGEDTFGLLRELRFEQKERWTIYYFYAPHSACTVRLIQRKKNRALGIVGVNIRYGYRSSFTECYAHQVTTFIKDGLRNVDFPLDTELRRVRLAALLD